MVSNFSPVPTVISFTWIALGDVDLLFSLMSLRKGRKKRKLNELHDYITNVISP